jgi:hypothetical protein
VCRIDRQLHSGAVAGDRRDAVFVAWATTAPGYGRPNRPTGNEITLAAVRTNEIRRRHDASPLCRKKELAC